MSISITRYVDITSSVAGASALVTRQLIGRFFTGNTLVPVNTFLEFTSASDVAQYFGQYTEEYYRALFYFSWISKENTYPQAIQFARWVNTATAPMIFSIPAPAQTFVLATWTAITSGSLFLTIGTHSFQMTGIDFSGAASAANVASILTTVIQAETGGGATWTSATVVYNGNGGFTLTGGVASTAEGNVNVYPSSSGTDISGIGLLGWLPSLPQNIIYNSQTYLNNAIWAIGSDVQTITAVLTASSALSNDFGSFAFLNNLSLTTQNIKDAASWNNGQNVTYMYSVPVTSSNYAAVNSDVNSFNGTALTLENSTLAITGTTVSATPTITNIPSSYLNQLYVGMPLSGTYIAANTFIIAISLSTTTYLLTITMSNNATGSSTTGINFGNGQYPEQFPMMIMAATDYTGLNTVQNYMFQQVAGLSSTVTTDSLANTYDAVAVNYYGQTQESGTNISFYQRGLMQGSAVVTNITDMSVYANEVWLKDAMLVAIMNLLLALTEVPANQYGRSQILTIMQSVINQALLNGSISVNKTLTANQIAFITTATGDPDAWYQVQNSGYWVDVVIEPIPSTSPTQYQATYTLIYSKNDTIRLVVGSDFLI